MPVFPKDEFTQRIEKTKQSMSAQGLEVVHLADLANMNYLTGYDSWSFYTPQVDVLSLEAPQPALAASRLKSWPTRPYGNGLRDLY